MNVHEPLCFSVSPMGKICVTTFLDLTRSVTSLRNEKGSSIAKTNIYD